MERLDINNVFFLSVSNNRHKMNDQPGYRDVLE